MSIVTQIKLEETKIVYQRQHDTVDGFKATGRAMLSSSSLIVSIIGSFQIVTSFGEGLGTGFRIGWFLFGIALYIALIWVALRSILPVGFVEPISPTEENLDETFDGLSDEDARKKLLATYIVIIPKNDVVIRRLKKRLDLAGALLFGVVTVMVTSSIISVLVQV